MRWILAVVMAGATFGIASADGPQTDATTRDAVSRVDARAPHPCPGATRVTIRAAAEADAWSACEGVERALEFLGRAGLAAPPGTTVDIVPQLPGELGGRAVGCWISETRGVVLLTYAAFEAIGEWFRVPIDRALYRAVAAHEMAHAVVGCHAGPAPLPVAAHEYVAYVVFFATMEPRLRERILAKFPGTGFDSTLQINDLGHLVDPNRFGVDAWRHYLRRRDRDAWLREVVAGNVVQPMFGDGP